MGIFSKHDKRHNAGTTNYNHQSKIKNLQSTRIKSILKKPQSSDNKESSPSDDKLVRFNHIHLREYERVVGDNPSCSSGAPIGIGWAHTETKIMTIDYYQSHKVVRRSQMQMVLSRTERQRLLLNWGASGPEVVDSIRANIRVKNQRRRTVNNLGTYDKIEEKLQNVSRKLKYALLLQTPTSQVVRRLQSEHERVVNNQHGISMYSTSSTIGTNGEPHHFHEIANSKNNMHHLIAPNNINEEQQRRRTHQHHQQRGGHHQQQQQNGAVESLHYERQRGGTLVIRDVSTSSSSNNSENSEKRARIQQRNASVVGNANRNAIPTQNGIPVNEYHYQNVRRFHNNADQVGVSRGHHNNMERAQYNNPQQNSAVDGYRNNDYGHNRHIGGYNNHSHQTQNNNSNVGISKEQSMQRGHGFVPQQNAYAYQGR